MNGMKSNREILCIGSVLWDVIGRSASHMRLGSDVPGRITRIPGGVAMNIAMTLARFDLVPVLLTAIGRDDQGDELIHTAARMGMVTDHIYRSVDLPTDIYMAVEGANGLIAAIADAHSLEAAGAKILTPLSNGVLGSANNPYSGTIALDGNLTESLLAEIATSDIFAKTNLCIAPASPGKAERLHPLFKHPNTTFYVNLEEAGLICNREFKNAEDAALALIDKGASNALVTNGSDKATSAGDGGVTSLAPPEVMVTRVTGAGDTFMAAHIAATISGSNSEQALRSALRAAANYVSGDTPQ